MTELLSRIDNRINAYEEDVVAFQTELVACPALGPVNGGQGELQKTLIVEEWLKKLSPDEMIRIDAPDSRVESGIRPNLLAMFKGEDSTRPKVWVLSHTDIVPVGERSLWDSDPFTLRRDGDLIYGRGVEDNHQGIMSSYFAMKALRDEGLRPPVDVGLFFVADEETGSRFGLQHILIEKPDLFSPEDLIIVPDGGDPEGAMVEIAEKSICWIKFTVKGKQCHASTPTKGVNTLRASARLIVALDDAFSEKFTAEDALYNVPFSTFEPTMKLANVENVNTIPGEDVFFFDARVLPQYRLEDVLREAKNVAGLVEKDSGVTVSIETTQEVQAPEPTPTDAPVVRALGRAIKAVHGREARPMGVGGGTVAAFYRKMGLPAAVWSTIDNNAHQPNEFARISNQLADAKVLARVFSGY